MSFTDPLSVTISGSTISLPRTSVGTNKAEYLSADAMVKVTASHAYNKRTRRILRVDHAKIASDVFKPAEYVSQSMSNYIVFDTPRYGYTATEAQAVWTGFKTMLTASSDALIVKLLSGES
jgi:hypothetical protein